MKEEEERWGGGEEGQRRVRGKNMNRIEGELERGKGKVRGEVRENNE